HAASTLSPYTTLFRSEAHRQMPDGGPAPYWRRAHGDEVPPATGTPARPLHDRNRQNPGREPGGGAGHRFQQAADHLPAGKAPESKRAYTDIIRQPGRERFRSQDHR